MEKEKKTPVFKDLKFYLNKKSINDRLPDNILRGDILFNKLCQCDCNFMFEYLALNEFVREDLEPPQFIDTPMGRGRVIIPTEQIRLQDALYDLRVTRDFLEKCKCPLDPEALLRRVQEMRDDVFISRYLKTSLEEHKDLEDIEKEDFEIAKQEVREHQAKFESSLREFKEAFEESKVRNREEKGRGEKRKGFNIPID